MLCEYSLGFFLIAREKKSLLIISYFLWVNKLGYYTHSFKWLPLLMYNLVLRRTKVLGSGAICLLVFVLSASLFTPIYILQWKIIFILNFYTENSARMWLWNLCNYNIFWWVLCLKVSIQSNYSIWCIYVFWLCITLVFSKRCKMCLCRWMCYINRAVFIFGSNRVCENWALSF